MKLEPFATQVAFTGALSDFSLVHLSKHLHLWTADQNGLHESAFATEALRCWFCSWLPLFSCLCKPWEPPFYHRGIRWLIPQLANHRTPIPLRQQTTRPISALACCHHAGYLGFVPFPKARGESQTGTADNSNKRNQGTHITASFLLPNQSSVASFCMLYGSS